MGLLTTPFSLLLLAGPLLQEPRPAPPTPEQIAIFKTELEAALEPGADPKVRSQKILRSRDHVDASVIAVLDQKALRHEDRKVRDQAVHCLGFMNHPDASKALAAMLARDEKELESAPPRYANLVRALARRGDPSAIPLLVKDLSQSGDRGVIQARILGLGNIRTKESVDELIQIMRSAGRPRVADVMLEMRTALYMLTGVDKGTDQELWLNWYGDSKNALVIPPEPPEERPLEIRRCWSLFWGSDAGKHKLEPADEKGKPDMKGKKKAKREQGEKDE